MDGQETTDADEKFAAELAGPEGAEHAAEPVAAAPVKTTEPVVPAAPAKPVEPVAEVPKEAPKEVPAEPATEEVATKEPAAPVEVEKVDANLQESMMKPEEKQVTADEIIEQHHNESGDVPGSKKSNPMTVIGIAVAVAVLLVGLGLAAVFTTQSDDEEPTTNQTTPTTTEAQTQQPTGEETPAQPVDQTTLDEEIKAVDDALAELESVEDVSADGISDSSLDF